MSLRRITSVATATAVAFSLAAAPAAHADVSIHKDRANNTCTIKLTGNSRAALLGVNKFTAYYLGKEILGPAKIRDLEDNVAALFEKMRADGVDLSSDEATETWFKENSGKVEEANAPTVKALKEKGLRKQGAEHLTGLMVDVLAKAHRGMDIKFSSIGVVDSLTISDVAVRREDAGKFAIGSNTDDLAYAPDYGTATSAIDYYKLLHGLKIGTVLAVEVMEKAAKKVANSYNNETEDLRKVSREDYIKAKKDFDTKYKDCASFIKENHSGKSKGNDVKKDGQSKGSSEGTSPVLIVVGVLVALAAAAAGAVGAGLIQVPGLPGAPR